MLEKVRARDMEPADHGQRHLKMQVDHSKLNEWV
jgi:hypothetical protein